MSLHGQKLTAFIYGGNQTETTSLFCICKFRVQIYMTSLKERGKDCGMLSQGHYTIFFEQNTGINNSSWVGPLCRL